MSMTDPVSDMLTRIRNGQKARKVSVSMPASTVKVAVAGVLKDEGYITDFTSSGEGATKTLSVELKYFEARRLLKKYSVSASRACVFTAARMICRKYWAVLVLPSYRLPQAS